MTLIVRPLQAEDTHSGDRCGIAIPIFMSATLTSPLPLRRGTGRSQVHHPFFAGLW